MRLPLDVSNIKIVDENNFILLADYDNNSYNLNDLKGEEREKAIKEIEENKSYYRNFIGQKMAKQVRAIPQLNFYLDTSLDDVEKLERELKGLGDNPIL